MLLFLFWQREGWANFTAPDGARMEAECYRKDGGWRWYVRRWEFDGKPQKCICGNMVTTLASKTIIAEGRAPSRKKGREICEAEAQKYMDNFGKADHV